MPIGTNPRVPVQTTRCVDGFFPASCAGKLLPELYNDSIIIQRFNLYSPPGGAMLPTNAPRLGSRDGKIDVQNKHCA